MRSGGFGLLLTTTVRMPIVEPYDQTTESTSMKRRNISLGSNLTFHHPFYHKYDPNEHVLHVVMKTTFK